MEIKLNNKTKQKIKMIKSESHRVGDNAIYLILDSNKKLKIKSIEIKID